jgi:hypothetical protein
MLKYYASSYIFTAIAVICGFLLAGPGGAWAVAVLGILEVSLSFDNAVVNASVLKNWGPLWRRRFLVWGMPIAVFGMRLVFPLLIVGVIGHLGPVEAIMLALKHPAEYARVLTSAHTQIAAFGGTFLMMVFLKFFLDDSKDQHWVQWLEAPLTKLSRFTEVIVLMLLIVFSLTLSTDIQFNFLLAGICGLVTFLAVEVLGSMMGSEEGGDGGDRIIKEGIGGFIYLEVLDASFSFDGVIGAFALSENIFIIVLGLGVGAMFVRSMTLMLVDKGSMSEFRYLEHGAFWAIGALAIIMFVGVKREVPELITGFIGAAAIGTALWSSIRANRQDAAAVALAS